MGPWCPSPRVRRTPSFPATSVASSAAWPATRARLGLISGRALPDLRRLVGVRGAAYAGCHGLEVLWRGRGLRHHGAVAPRPLMQRVARELRGRTQGLRGVFVEPKGLAVGLHFRQADRAALPRLLSVAQAVAAGAPALEELPGKKVLEWRPRVSWGKGEAVRLLRRLLARSLRQPAPVVVFLGDDTPRCGIWVDHFAATLRSRGSLPASS